MSTHSKAAVRVTPKAPPAGLWVPKEGQMLLIELPSERLLALVAKAVSPDVVICELVATPIMQKYHRHEKGDLVPCERVHTDLETVWRAFKPAPRAEPTPPPKTRRKRKAKH